MIRDNYYVYCPYCNHEIVISKRELDVDADVFYMSCPSCSSELQVSINYKPIFSVQKIEERTCLECGSPTKFIAMPERKIQKYADVPNDEYCLCNSCNTRLMMSEVTNESFKFILKKSRK